MAVVTYSPLVIANHARHGYLATPIIFDNFPTVVGSPFLLGVIPVTETVLTMYAVARGIKP